MHILLVEDDTMVQQVCQGMLRVLDHSSTAVSNAIDAVERLTATPQEFDLVILDNGLPGLSGMELFSILREWNISIPVILISGIRPQLEADGVIEEPSHFQFLAKPFTIADLQSALERSRSRT
ncbi:MAG: response regulator [Planctomycetaceae bacterium]